METQLVNLEIGSTLANWKIDAKLGEGAFGVVYKCVRDGKSFALKVEGVNEPIQMLKMEAHVLMELSKRDAGRHFCAIEDKGQIGGINYIVMTLLGRSLQDLRLARPDRKFSMGTAISVGIQCLEALEDLHSIGYLHRDIKPGNYTIGRAELGELQKVYMLDFGMARRFAHPDGTIRKPREAAGFRGTLKYAPLSSHIQRELCRKDDIESWLYQQVEITRGTLPWRNLRDKLEVGRCKKNCRSERGLRQLFGACPRQYIDILQSVDRSKFFDEPDYGLIYGLLRDAMKTTESKEFPYDWEPTV
ncbi:protein kinase domain-containing protein [Ditylenchus destructor]|uniref:non-specific serine/threonine protein kinase n=1 Tax=Ditylenchus destructor TaxID=166010 RepID=A0AAD4R4U0_9BILA|nr:protein kinase domain-containing protein [Ditylenchus destructor]